MKTVLEKIQPFNLRIPPALRFQLEQAARENENSLNREIIQRLRRSFEGYRKL